MSKLLQIFIFLIIVYAVIFLTCTSTDTEEETMEMQVLVPGEFSGWKLQQDVETYNRETIFDYINGAGEIYLMYGFKKVEVFHLAKDDQPVILVEVFDMGSPEEAFGIFSHAREGAEGGIGQGSEFRGGVLCFWKGNFFICISSYQETPETQKTIPLLAGEISRKITVTGEKPKLLNYLPAEGLQKNTVRFFHKHTSLNFHYFLASDNILQLGEHTQAVLAKYLPGNSILLCVLYQNEREAKTAIQSFLGAYIPEAVQSGITRLDENKWVAAKSKGPFVLVVFDVPTKNDAQKLMNAAEAELPGLSSKKGEIR
jgi:hypothetical protein